MSATPLNALLRRDDDGTPTLHAPAPGTWVDPPAEGARVRPGDPLGALRILDRRHPLLAPAGADGLVSRPLLARGECFVAYGDRLMRLEPMQAVATGGMEVAAAATSTPAALVVRAPIHGIFYARPTPGAPLFAAPGTVVEEGATLALVEVMKTFHPLRYGGPGLPPRARIVAVETADGAEVQQGQVLFRVEEDGGT